MIVRMCTECEMYHKEDTTHLDDDQKEESFFYDVYHANGTIYYSVEYMGKNGKVVGDKKSV